MDKETKPQSSQEKNYSEEEALKHEKIEKARLLLKKFVHNEQKGQLVDNDSDDHDR